MFSIFGTETRRLPRQSRMPWDWIVIIVVVVALAFLFLSDRDTPFTGVKGQVETAPVSSQVQPAESQPAPAVPVVVKEWPIREAKWDYVGKAGRSRTEIEKLSLPESKTSFIPGPALKAEWNFFTEHAHGYGDGTVGCALASGEEILYCTPDRGESWFKVPNLYPGKTLTPPEIVGAVREKDALVPYLELQVEPWVFSYWRAEFR